MIFKKKSKCLYTGLILKRHLSRWGNILGALKNWKDWRGKSSLRLTPMWNTDIYSVFFSYLLHPLPVQMSKLKDVQTKVRILQKRNRCLSLNFKAQITFKSTRWMGKDFGSIYWRRYKHVDPWHTIRVVKFENGVIQYYWASKNIFLMVFLQMKVSSSVLSHLFPLCV